MLRTDKIIKHGFPQISQIFADGLKSIREFVVHALKQKSRNSLASAIKT